MIWLVVGLEHDWIIFPETVGNFMIPIDELQSFSEGFKPPTSDGWDVDGEKRGDKHGKMVAEWDVKIENGEWDLKNGG